ncbi:sensor histidine kinase [Methylomonas sp. MS20]|uniref:sensor histidine kinase n=1 Tax=Methylomonas sp. MS20 TaxID=3418769 RepID=UPI003D060E58
MTARADQAGMFPAVLASTVHDIKNSLGILLELTRQLAVKYQDRAEDINQLEFEATHINHTLMQLLVLYKIDADKFCLMIDAYPVIDILNEARDQQSRLSRLNHVEVVIECPDDLLCFCDYPQITNALATILNNALRYTREKILVSAVEQDGYLRLAIEDDGKGYPSEILDADLSSSVDLDWIGGNTGLGLFFVSVIAALHKNGEQSGYVRVDNRSRLGGARFCLFLP